MVLKIKQLDLELQTLKNTLGGIALNNENETTNRVAEFEQVTAAAPAPRPSVMRLAQTGCTATLDEQGIIHIQNAQGQQLYAMNNSQMPFELQTLMVTLNLWFMAWGNGRESIQSEIKNKITELVKLWL